MGADATWSSVDRRTDVHPESFKHCAERRKPFQTLLPITLNFACTLQVTSGSMDSPECHVRAAASTKTTDDTHTPLHTTIPHTSGPNLENVGQHLRRRSTRSSSHSTHSHGATGTAGCSVYLDPSLVSPWATKERTTGYAGRDLQRSERFQTTLCAKFAKIKKSSRELSKN